MTVFSTPAEKKDDARRFGAKSFAPSTDTKEPEKRTLSFNFILTTIPELHGINPFVKPLKRDGALRVDE